MDFTIALCTWNRADLLDRALTRLEELRVAPHRRWELIVVDNASTDATADVIARHADSLPLRGGYEPVAGHSRARNRALATARGALVLWLDDDVEVDADWAEAYLRAAAEWPAAAFYGGPIANHLLADPPRWVRANLDLLASPYGLRRLGDFVGRLPDDKRPFGANMATRRDLFPEFRFREELGRHGGDLMMSDETQFFDELTKAGHFGVWVGDARVAHAVTPERMTAAFVRGWSRGNARSTRLARRLANSELPPLPSFARLLGRYLRCRVAARHSPRRGRRWVASLRALGESEAWLAEWWAAC